LVLVRLREKAFWWIPANILGWLIGGSIGWVIGLLLLGAGASFPSAWVLGWATVGMVGSAALGIALARMPEKKERSAA
jgi:hypothetical protein